MIMHLQGRQTALAPLGWTGRKAEWIALACLHGEGIFSRAQLAFYLQMNRLQALRFVQALIRKGCAAEDKLEDQDVPVSVHRSFKIMCNATGRPDGR